MPQTLQLPSIFGGILVATGGGGGSNPHFKKKGIKSPNRLPDAWHCKPFEDDIKGAFPGLQAHENEPIYLQHAHNIVGGHNRG